MPKRILVVDDDPSIQRILQRALSGAGFEVFQARNGGEALDICTKEGVDLVITDIHMPDHDGIELILEFRKRGATTPVIVMSDGGRTGQPELLGDARLLGAVQSVPKPFSLADMLSAVKNALAPGPPPR